MSACTFFGHRRICENIEVLLRATLIELIEDRNVTDFYVGNEGQFDKMVRRVLWDLKKYYPYMTCTVVLAYLNQGDDIPDSIYPEGLECVPLRFAISKRNRIMIDMSDLVVAYVSYYFGGSGKALGYAEKKGKTIINIADMRL